MSFIAHGDILRGYYSGDDAPTSFDVSNIGNLSNEEIIKQVEEKLGLSLDDDESFVVINKIFQKVITYLKEQLLYQDLEIGIVRKKEFHTKQDIIDFLHDTKHPKGIIKCVIAKLAQAIADSNSEFNERIATIKEKTQGVIEKKMVRGLVIEDETEDELIGYTYIESQKGEMRKIHFKITKRLKSNNSLVSKEIRDPKYYTSDRNSDLYGATFEVEKKEDILPLMQVVAGVVFKKGDFIVKNDKGFFSEEDVYNESFLHSNMLKKILEGTKARDKEGSGNTQEIKLSSPYYKDDASKNMSLEIIFQIAQHKNELGTNMHGLYNYKKKIIERIRLEGAVTINYFTLLANHFIDNLQKNLDESIGRKDKDLDTYKKELFSDLRTMGFIDEAGDLRNAHIIANLDKILVNGLINYFKGQFIAVKRKGVKRICYTNKRANLMSQNNIGPTLDELIG